MTTPSDRALARVELPSIVITKGNRLWSVFEQRWIEMDDPRGIDLKKSALLLPPHVLRRQRIRRRLANRATRRRRQAGFLVVQAVLAAAIGFILGTLLIL